MNDPSSGTPEWATKMTAHKKPTRTTPAERAHNWRIIRYKRRSEARKAKLVSDRARDRDVQLHAKWETKPEDWPTGVVSSRKR